MSTQLMIVVYARDMNESVPFYETLGLERSQPGEIDEMWNEFAVGDGALALHGLGSGDLPVSTGRVQVNINVLADGTLDTVLARCKDRDYDIGAGIGDQGFGRFFWVRDPDGLPVQVNERTE